MNSLNFFPSGAPRPLYSARATSGGLQSERVSVGPSLIACTASVIGLSCSTPVRALSVERVHLQELQKAQSLTLSAKTQLNAGRVPEAIDFFTQSLQMTEKVQRVSALQGNIYRMQGNPLRFQIEIKRALHMNDDLHAALIGRADAFYRQGNFKFALEDLIRASLIDNTNAEALALLCAVHRKLGNIDEGMVCLQKAFNLDDQCLLAILVRGQIHLENENLDQAVVDFSEVLKVNPKNLQARKMLTQTLRERATLYQQRGRSALAIADLNKSLEISIYDAPTFALLGDLCRQEGLRYEGLPRAVLFATAISHLSLSIALDFDVAYTFAARGDVYRQLNEIVLAIQDSEKALELNPHEPLALSTLSDIRPQ